MNEFEQVLIALDVALMERDTSKGAKKETLELRVRRIVLLIEEMRFPKDEMGYFSPLQNKVMHA